MPILALAIHQAPGVRSAAPTAASMLHVRQPISAAFAGIVTAASLLTTPSATLNAQQPARAVDTAAVLTAVAAAWSATTSAGARVPWYVRTDDSLTLKFAAAIEQPTRAAPPRILCSFDAPAGAVTGSLTYVELRIATPERVIVSVAHTCTRTAPSAVGGFYQADHFEVLRRGGTWTARHAAAEIS
jgi:hypothetical protein